MVSVLMRTVGPAKVESSTPTANDADNAGRLTGPPSVPLKLAVRPGTPLLKMMTADAPAAAALAALVPKVQVPRWISAMLPGTKPAKSAASHPLVLSDVGAGGFDISTGWTTAVTSPLPEYCSVPKSGPLP